MRLAWSTTATEAESRTYLQARLTVLFELMFWSFVALLTFLKLLYGAYPEIEPKSNIYMYEVSVVGLAIMAFLWRGVLVRRTTLSLRQLHAIDLFYATGTGVVFALSAVIAYDFRPSAYCCLTYQCFAVLTRGLIVPSTWRRSAVAGALAFAPMAVAAYELPGLHHQEVPPTAFVAGFFLIGGVAVLLSAAGSHIIYGLNRLVRETKLGQYALVRKLDEGGIGELYLAHHMMLRRPTAVKRLLPARVGANLARFERAVHAMSELTHPNAVVVFDYGRSDDGGFYYAMEYLGDGISLEHLVRTDGAQPGARVAPILIQICGALQEAHDRGLVHHGIKPATIILCERGGVPDVAKAVDFGLVQDTVVELEAERRTVRGTPEFVAPEQVTDPSQVGPATDIYALGAVGYFLLTGRNVFEGDARAQCEQHAHATPSPPSTHRATDRGLEAVVLQCLAKRPSERFASAAELAVALRGLPLADDWDGERARIWWRDRHAASSLSESAPDLAASLIRVDLGERVPEEDAA
jgi:eukaryotic-like serine/threonine-protein kinase